MNENTQERARRLIARAELDLGKLSQGQKTDLLLDNLPSLKNCAEAREIVLSLCGAEPEQDGSPDVLLIDDWFIWVWLPGIRRIREYCTECWPEWLSIDPDGLGSNVPDVSPMVPFLSAHSGDCHLLDYTFSDREDALTYLKTGEYSYPRETRTGGR